MGTEAVHGRFRTGSLVGESFDIGQTIAVAFETNIGRIEVPLQRRSGSPRKEWLVREKDSPQRCQHVVRTRCTFHQSEDRIVLGGW